MDALLPITGGGHAPCSRVGGRVVVRQRQFSSGDFASESALLDYVEVNVQKFCQDVLGGRYVGHEREKRLSHVGWGGRHRGVKSVDLVVESDDTTFVVEAKHPRYGSEMTRAVGQLLDYGRAFPDTIKKKQLVLLTSGFDNDAGETIIHYRLPIRYIYVSRSACLEYMGAA